MEDSRFSRVSRDPRFVRSQKRDVKVSIDSRFKGMFTDKEFKDDFSGSVDKYGRRKTSTKEHPAVVELRRFYRLEGGEAEGEDSVRLDLARGEGQVLSTDSEEDDESGESAYSANPSAIDTVSLPQCDATSRLAIVNLDWDNIKAQDIFQLVHGFKSALGQIVSVKIYLSDFGKERVAQESQHGPPLSIFRPVSAKEEEVEYDSEAEDVVDTAEDVSAASDVEQLSEEEDDGSEEGEDSWQGSFSVTQKDFDEDALRMYQLERLRYHYAVVETDSVETARSIYDGCDGKEFEKTCNVIDMRFVADDMKFEDEDCIDESRAVDEKYCSRDFTTGALNHSSVKLTWDADDAKRIRITRARFSKDALDDMDFRAYLASSSSEEEDVVEKYRILANSEIENNAFGKHGQREKWEKGEKDVDMVATFSAAGVPEEKEETVFESMLRKEREKKKARKADRKGLHMDHVKSKEDSEDLSLFVDDSEDAKRHFSMTKILKAEKKKKRDSGDAFKISTEDPRFGEIFTSHAYAIDPSHPSFKDTTSMRKLMEARSVRDRTSN